MYSFLFRKTVFDVWDHVIGFFLANLGYVALMGLGFLWWHLNSSGALDMPFAALLILLTLLIASFYTMVIAVFTYNITAATPKEKLLEGTGRILKGHVGHILLHAFITMIVFVNAAFAIPFYLQMGGFVGPLFAFVALFLSLFLISHFKYYLPLCLINPEASVLDVIKYSFAYALDNRKTTAFLMLRTLLDVVISIPFIGMIPGFTGILASDMCAARILNTRYVMAEERNPSEPDKNTVPLEEVIESMNGKRYRNRRFISLIFPGR